MRTYLKKIRLSCCAILLLGSLVSCQKSVVLIPKDDDLVMLNGCVVSACNYLAVVKAQHVLNENFWARILLVKFANHPAGHAYCVWETDGTVYGYDRNAGAFPIPVYTRDARTIALVLAQELSNVMHEPLAVSQAEFVNSSEAKLYTFGSLAESVPPPQTTLLAVASGGIQKD